MASKTSKLLQSCSKLLQGSKSASKTLKNAKMLECAHMHIQCFQIPPKNTNQALVHLQTPNGLQNFEAPPKLFKTPPRLKSAFKTLKSANLHLQHTQTLKISLNAHKQSNL
jgi:hypothetical protein